MWRHPRLARRELPALAARVSQLTLIEFKSPTDISKTGDLDQFFALAHHFRSQQRPIPLRSELTLIVLAPQISGTFRYDAQRSNLTLIESEPGVYSLTGAFFTLRVMETNRIAGLRASRS